VFFLTVLTRFMKFFFSVVELCFSFIYMQFACGAYIHGQTWYAIKDTCIQYGQ